MKIAYLAPADSIHTARWVAAFAAKGNIIHVITMHPGRLESNVTVHELPFRGAFGYYSNVPRLKTLLNDLRPDLLHVHYASGYGTLGRLANYQPSILSVWGSDVYDFPNESRMKGRILYKNLKYATWVCSTSSAMAEHTLRVCPEIQNLTVTPFGVDTSVFRPIESIRDGGLLTVGTVKTLAPKYGVDLLIRGFALLINELSTKNTDWSNKLRLMIIGGGAQKDELMRLTKSLKVDHLVNFVGPVQHERVPEYLSKLDIYVAMSRLESFGVAVIEASACGLPVVVSDVGGLPEVVNHGVTGYVVPSESVEKLSAALLDLVLNPIVRQQMAANGREWVMQKYDWNDSVRIMDDVYDSVLAKVIH